MSKAVRSKTFYGGFVVVVVVVVVFVVVVFCVCFVFCFCFWWEGCFDAIGR